MEAGLGEDENEKQQEKGGDGTDDEADGGNEADAAEARLNRRHHDDGEYEGEDDEQDEVQEKLEPSGVLDEMEENMDNSEEEDNPEVIEDDNENVEMNKSKRSEMLDANRVADVRKTHPLIEDYHYDAQDEKWCSITFQAEINKFVVREVPGIEKCILRNESKSGREVSILQTQGINIEALYRRSDVLDVNSFYSNDINRMLSTYGIEACGRTIVKEMNNVFGVYGIEVNPRHLSLTADYMTFTGEVQPFSRGAMAHCASPLQRMTFETTVTFMRDSIINGEADSLISPSARLVTGQLQRTGTGSFDLLAEPRYMTDMSESTTRMLLQTTKKQKRKNPNESLDDGEKRKKDL
ncbi:RNA polymerase rpb1, domain 5 domain-containing protein [Ditylenchus destructor]|nr:RNA polymerase rpb1, domain 5 domain-containing protein [Ditylenchus destructor]